MATTEDSHSVNYVTLGIQNHSTVWVYGAPRPGPAMARDAGTRSRTASVSHTHFKPTVFQFKTISSCPATAGSGNKFLYTLLVVPLYTLKGHNQPSSVIFIFCTLELLQRMQAGGGLVGLNIIQKKGKPCTSKLTKLPKKKQQS